MKPEEDAVSNATGMLAVLARYSFAVVSSTWPVSWRC